METGQHLNVDARAQGGDNEDQTPQIGGANASGTAVGIGTGESNAGASYNASSADGPSDSAQDHDAKSDLNDYSASVTNDGLTNSSDNLGQADGAHGAGSVANLAVSTGDVLQGGGAGTGAAAGNQSNAGGMTNDYSGTTAGASE